MELQLMKTAAATAKRLITAALADADIIVGGSRPQDIRVSDERFFGRAAFHGSLGLGGSYVDGWWDCPKLDLFFRNLLGSGVADRQKGKWPEQAAKVIATLVNRQDPRRASQDVPRHYDQDLELFGRMLGRRKKYSCAYGWKPGVTLDVAQDQCLDLIWRKIGLVAGDSVLDIGCGWGSFVGFAAERGARVTGVTISPGQADYCRKTYASLPIEIRTMDYRGIEGTFDHVVSVGMIEHVGPKNYGTFMEVARRCIKDDGLFLLHTIGGRHSGSIMDPWFEKYIFPGTKLPSLAELTRAAEGKFIVEDVQNFGVDYAATLRAWHENVTRDGWLRGHSGERFARMWEYYLLSLAGSFDARYIELWQLVLSPKGVPGGYITVR